MVTRWDYASPPKEEVNNRILFLADYLNTVSVDPMAEDHYASNLINSNRLDDALAAFELFLRGALSLPIYDTIQNRLHNEPQLIGGLGPRIKERLVVLKEGLSHPSGHDLLGQRHFFTREDKVLFALNVFHAVSSRRYPKEEVEKYLIAALDMFPWSKDLGRTAIGLLYTSGVSEFSFLAERVLGGAVIPELLDYTVNAVLDPSDEFAQLMHDYINRHYGLVESAWQEYRMTRLLN